MTLSVEVSPEVLARLEAAASACRVTVEQLAGERLAQAAAADAEVLDVPPACFNRHGRIFSLVRSRNEPDRLTFIGIV